MPYASVNGHYVHFTDTLTTEPERGSGKAPIIMIHGLGSSQNYYMPVIPLLEGYRCIALDTYGAGRSKSHGKKLSLEGLAKDVVSLMDSLSIPKAVVAGHSMGGPMACRVAAASPDRVAGLVCIGPVHPAMVKPEIFQARIDTVLKDGMEPLANSIPKAATNSKSTPLQQAIIRELIFGQVPAAYASHCRVIMEMKDPGFDSIKAPTLILAGDEDQSAPLAGCQKVEQDLGCDRKELKVMKGVGHWHCVEASEEVAREIAAFCSSL